MWFELLNKYFAVYLLKLHQILNKTGFRLFSNSDRYHGSEFSGARNPLAVASPKNSSSTNIANLEEKKWKYATVRLINLRILN